MPVTGSTLYRRLPDGTWAAEREDPGSAAPPLPPQPAGPQQTVVGATPRRRRRWSVWRVLRWTVGAYVAWLIGLLVYATVMLPTIEALSANPIPDTDGSVWLLVGSDSRAGLTRREQRELRTGDEEGQRTDTIMLVHQQVGRAPTLISIPRDSWVTIPEHASSDGEQVPARGGKVNAAYAYGGAPLLSETIEYNTGLHVDHYMEVGMGGIVSMTDAVGGIEVCFEEAISDQNSGLDVEAGCQTLDGKGALAWVRMRYADPTGDLGRMQRQQEYLRLMMDEMISWQTILNPVRQWQVVNAVLDSIAVDVDSGGLDLGRLGLGMARIASGSGEITTVPVDDSDHWENGQWVIKWDSAEAGQLFGSLGGQPPQAAQVEQ